MFRRISADSCHRFQWPALVALLLLSLTIPGFADGAEPEPEAPARGEEIAVLETSLGTMKFRLFADEAPRTVANFRRLLKEGFYDGLPFYRVVSGHVIQAGDGGESEQPSVPGEFGAHPHVVGALGLARDADPNSGSTEIYVCHAVRSHLDGSYAVFGLLFEGFEVLDNIAKVKVKEQWEGEVAFHRPVEPVLIEKAYLSRQGK